MTRHGSPAFRRAACALPAMVTLTPKMPLRVLTNISRPCPNPNSSGNPRLTTSFRPNSTHPFGRWMRLKPTRKPKNP